MIRFIIHEKLRGNRIQGTCLDDQVKVYIIQEKCFPDPLTLDIVQE